MIALLAAGQSQRFGTADKLSAELNGTMLGLHASDTLAALPADHRIVIASSDEHACADGWHTDGFQIAVNPDADLGMGTSVALAARLAAEEKAEALLIALADMPFVPLTHLKRLAACSAPNALYASCSSVKSSSQRMPPALFGFSHFTALISCDGEQGARDLIRQAQLIQVAPEFLADIDHPSDLERLEKR